MDETVGIKQLKLLITFPSTAQALHMEQCCRAEGAEGRMIPVPREISAGCGMAWMAGTGERGRLEEILSREAIEIEEIYELLL